MATSTEKRQKVGLFQRFFHPSMSIFPRFPTFPALSNFYSRKGSVFKFLGRYEILLTKTPNQYSCGQRLTGRHTSSAGNLFGIPPVLPVCRPWFAQVRDKSFHTHKPVYMELVVFDMLHVTGVSADFSVFRKKSFMSQSGFLSVLVNQFEPFRFK